jgi:hypothetical protein
MHTEVFASLAGSLEAVATIGRGRAHIGGRSRANVWHGLVLVRMRLWPRTADGPYRPCDALGDGEGKGLVAMGMECCCQAGAFCRPRVG